MIGYAPCCWCRDTQAMHFINAKGTTRCSGVFFSILNGRAFCKWSMGLRYVVWGSGSGRASTYHIIKTWTVHEKHRVQLGTGKRGRARAGLAAQLRTGKRGRARAGFGMQGTGNRAVCVWTSERAGGFSRLVGWGEEQFGEHAACSCPASEHLQLLGMVVIWNGSGFIKCLCWVIPGCFPALWRKKTFYRIKLGVALKTGRCQGGCLIISDVVFLS